MSKIIKAEKVSLKNNSTITEDMIQSYIFEDPSILGLGDLQPIKREKIQPSGGRIDILLSDDSGTRYETEIQLGATDPSHIIRTIEYWDLERKRYPQYDHCAIIIAEEITGRFMNVISLFNGTIPLIALQMSAFRQGDDIILTFSKVLDRVTYADDSEEAYQIVDRKYWDNKSPLSIMKMMDTIYIDLAEYTNGYTLNYNKNYIGVAKNGISRNFIIFQPRKNCLLLQCKGTENIELKQEFADRGLELVFNPKFKDYSIKIYNIDEFKKNCELFEKLIKISKEHMEIIE